MFMYFKFMFLGSWFCPNCQATTNNASHEQDTNAEAKAKVCNNSTIEVTKESNLMKIQDLEDELNKTKIALPEAQEQNDLKKKESYALTENNQALEKEKYNLLEKVVRQDQEIQKLNKINFDTKGENEKLQLDLNEANNKIETMQHIQDTKSRNNRIEVKDLKAKLKDSNSKLEKLRNLLAAKLFLFDPDNENLQALQNMEIEKLFSKYDQRLIVKDPFKDKYEEAIETLSDIKIKLRLQVEQRELHEKQHGKVLDILDINREDRSFAMILPAIQKLKELHDTQEQTETEHYTNAQALIETITSPN